MSDNTDQTGAPKKRKLKDPETFRERALKATDEKAKAPKSSGALKKFFSAVFGPIGRLGKRIYAIKALKPVFKVLSFIGKIIWPNYFRSSFRELKLVTWPSFKQSRKLTYAVIAFAVVFGAAIALVDYGLSKIFKHLLLK